jgi:putative restriction endonuclease
MPERVYGEIAGFPPGSRFVNRRDLTSSRVHRPPQEGIWGGKDGAESIVVSGGYIDDEDYGHTLIYTGRGGRDADSGKQVADQELTHGNAGLARSRVEGHPVRVVRGAGGDPDHSPAEGLRYDGLFRVVDFWHEPGRDGFRIWRFKLVEQEVADLDQPGNEPDQATVRRTATTQRIVRDVALAQRVKDIHNHECQVCGHSIRTPVGPYAEAAHIRALGRPHAGPDVLSNLLCLCPNHHIMFDTGAIYINDNWKVCDSATHKQIGPLRRLPKHRIGRTFVAYHRNHHVP